MAKRSYSEELKRTVAGEITKGEPILTVANRHGITWATARGWHEKFGTAPDGAGEATAAAEKKQPERKGIRGRKSVKAAASRKPSRNGRRHRIPAGRGKYGRYALVVLPPPGSLALVNSEGTLVQTIDEP